MEKRIKEQIELWMNALPGTTLEIDIVNLRKALNYLVREDEYKLLDSRINLIVTKRIECPAPVCVLNGRTCPGCLSTYPNIFNCSSEKGVCLILGSWCRGTENKGTRGYAPFMNLYDSNGKIIMHTIEAKSFFHTEEFDELFTI